MDVIDLLRRDLKLSISQYQEIEDIAHKKVKKFRIAKKKGGYRLIHSPEIRLRLVQHWLIENLFSSFPVHDSAMAYRPGKSIRDNAQYHHDNVYFVIIDFRNFFPSIVYDDFKRVLEHKVDKSSEVFSDEQKLKEIVKKFAFDEIERLPIGYCSSPSISNLVMHKFDSDVIEVVSNIGENTKYSRYADDLVISTRTKYASKTIYSNVKDCIQRSRNPRLQINYDKVKFLSSKSGSAYVTGLKINDSHISIGRKQKDEIRLLLSLYRKEILYEEEINRLIGLLSYTRYVDAAFFTKICSKYYAEIGRLL